ncbi:hypothetical protein CTAYLR_010501 [Chrysophaeum taylorii]|uniref:Uncharacterized protein n=1 Tax=Chrysophaeum taylorii TaxID=2483200 RepID=A0AAD7UBF0_9STRA|nr:hypothetical protein CTAYLR_010501 [Chrysophaeum taylorii]
MSKQYSFPHLVGAASAKFIVVHLHYFESDEYDVCKVVVKRTNLAVFVTNAVLKAPPNVTFVVTASSPMPNASNFFESISLEPWGDEVLPPVVHFHQVNNTETDLCPREHVIREYDDASHYLFIFSTTAFLNDGARGPFGDEWLSTLAWPFVVDPTTRLAGVVMSCALRVHVQSWAMVVDARIKAEFLQLYAEACTMNKTDAIVHSEIGAGSATLNHGTIASLWPPLYGFSVDAAECLARGDTPALYIDLHKCANPLAQSRFRHMGPGTEFRTPAKLSDIVFTKFGGDVMPLMPWSYRQFVANETASLFRRSQLGETPCFDRTNLAVFVANAILLEAPPPQNAMFIITTTSPFPPAKEFFESVGIEPWGEDLFPASVVVRPVSSTKIDLCHRASILRDFNASHYLFVNDGARGPFGANWLETLAWPFRLDNSTLVAGIVLSCSQYVHVESWAIVVDARVKDSFAEIYEGSCNLPRPKALRHGDIGAGRMFLQTYGSSMAALWPPLHGLTQESAACLMNDDARILRRDLNDCQSPFDPAGNFHFPQNLSDIVFTKFVGGDVTRPENSSSYEARVIEETAAIFRQRPRLMAEAQPHVVHLHYYESRKFDRCTILTKRTNLAVFVANAVLAAPKNVTFVVTTGSSLPNASEFFGSTGVEPWGRTVLPANVVVRRVPYARIDLCHRASVLREFYGSHYLFLNDGVRGPFGEHWLETLAWPFHLDPSTGVTGVVLSCSHFVHVESWAIVVHSRVKELFLGLYKTSCTLPKPKAIRHGEIGAGRAILQVDGTSIAALWPPLHGFARSAAACLTSNDAPILRRDLNDCHDRFDPAGNFTPPPKLSDIVFTKFDGDVMHDIPESFEARVAAATAAALLRRRHRPNKTPKFRLPQLAEAKCRLFLQDNP